VFGFGVEVGLQYGKDVSSSATRAETGRFQCGDADLRRQQQLAVAQDPLAIEDAGPPACSRTTVVVSASSSLPA
jgi:hypothetical protein